MADNAETLNSLSQELKASRQTADAPVADAPVAPAAGRTKSTPPAPVGEPPAKP